MQILGIIEATKLALPVADTMQKMQKSLPGSEAVVLVFNSGEMYVMRLEFQHLVAKDKLVHESQADLEKAEMMHMIGVGLRNASRASTEWFKEMAPKILQDATEFDANSVKTLFTTNGLVYILIAYNGKWVLGGGKIDQGSNGESNDNVDGVGEEVF